MTNPITWTMRERDEGLELTFDHPVDQEGPEVDRINDKIYETYGPDTEIDWRDDQTCWVY